MKKSDSDFSAGLVPIALAPERLYDFANIFNLFAETLEDDRLEKAMLDKDHVQQAITVADLFINKETSKSRSLQQFINRANQPMLALNRQGGILEMNETAQSLFSLKDKDMPFQNHFSYKTKNELWSYLNRISVYNIASNSHFIDLIELERENSDQTYFVCLTPWKLDSENHCLLIQSVNIQWPGHMTPLLRKTFNLTDSEIDIFKSLSEGLSVTDTANQRNTSVATVRTQIREIYAKTGTTNQLQFIRMAISLAALTFDNVTSAMSSSHVGSKELIQPCYPREEHWHLMILPDGRKLDYAVFGDVSGTPCLFFHNELFGDIWPEPLTRYATSCGLKIILPARPYYRRSSEYPEGVNHPQQTARDFVALLDHLKIEEARVLSQTLGGMFALQFATMFEERVHSLCNISPMLPFTTDEQRSNMPPLHRLVSSFILRAPWMMEFLARTGIAFYLKDGPEAFLRRTFSSAPIDKKTLDNPYHMKTLIAGLEFGTHNFHKPYVAGFKHVVTNAAEQMKALKVPMTVIIGDADNNTRQDRAKSLIEDGVKLNVVLAKDGGELLIFTHPELIIDTVLSA